MNISLFFGLLLAFGAGWMMLEKLSFKTVSLEKAAYSMLFGLGLQSWWMFLLDIINFQFSQSVLTVLNLVLIIALSDFDKLKQFKAAAFTNSIKDFVKTQLTNFHAGSAVAWLILIGLFYLIAVKSLFWPTTEHDAIGTFDKLGIWYAIEGKIHVSLYDVKLQGAGGIYPPLFPCSIAYTYLYGAENPKILSLLYYVCTLAIFYAVASRYISNFGAAIFTLVLGWAPEFFSHAALLLSNLPSTAYVAAAALPLFVWYKEREFRYFKIALLGILFSVWLRQDLLAFAVAGFAVVLLYLVKHKQWLPIVLYAAAVLIPFAAWSWYVKADLHLSTAERFGAGSAISLQKITMAAAYLWAYIGLGQTGSSPPGYFLYGIAFIFPILLIAFSAKSFFKTWNFTVLYFVAALAFYTLIFLLLDEKLQDASLQSLMESSYKRGMFCFMPIILFQAAATEKVQLFFAAIEKYLWTEE